MKKVPLTLWPEQRKTLEEAMQETIDAFYRIKAWEYDVWDIAFSGGKDSSALLSFLAYLLNTGQVPRPKRVFVHYADTGMEVPPLQQSALKILAKLASYGFETQVVRPALDERFFVTMLGRGIPPPNSVRLRWCTRVLKVKPMSTAMEAMRNHEKVLLITGVREGESAARDGNITALCSRDSGECGQGYMHVKYEKSEVADPFAPLRGWRVCHVFDWLTLYAPGKAYGGFDTETIAEIYGYDTQDGQEEPLDARTGCMECPLVTTPQAEIKPDKMIERVIALPKYRYLAPIQRLPEIYQTLLADVSRLQKDGTQRLKGGGFPKNPYRKGPLTLDARLWALAQVCQIQREINEAAYREHMPAISLISLEEYVRILQLIDAHTWPQGWTGREPHADVFTPPGKEPDAIQLELE